MRVVSCLMMSDDMGDGDWFPVAERSRTGGSGCCDWLYFVTQGAGLVAPPISGVEELSTLRRQWPVSLVAGMSNRPTDLELMRCDCKDRFRAHPTGACTYCGRNIVHDMAHHVSNFHLDLGQLWRCPVSWCTPWKGIPQDCIDHIRKKHNVGDSVKTVSLGKWFPPWTVTRAVWHTALKPNVSGISTDAALFSEHGALLVHQYRVFGDCAVHASLRG